MLKKKFRLTKKDSIENIMQSGKSLPGKFFLCKLLTNKLPYNRYTVVVSKKVEKSAAKRNKCRRRIYESIRQNIEKLNASKTHSDIVILTNKSTISAEYKDIERAITQLKI